MGNGTLQRAAGNIGCRQVVLCCRVSRWMRHRSPAKAADQVKIGISRTISDAGYYMADAMGFFRDEGMDVSITGFNSAAQMIAPLGTGELDVGGGTVSAGFYNAVGRGILMKIVADQASIKPGYGYSSLMVRKDLVDSGRYKSFADLKGMKVAIGAPGTGTASALNEALKKGGLKYSDVEVVYIGFPEHLPTYKNKGIDASITNEPTMTRAIEDGVAVRVAGNDVTYPDQQTAVTFFSDHFIKNRRDVAERFMRAYLRGVRMYNDALKDGRLAGPKANEVIPILVKYTTIKDESMFRRMIPSYCNPDGEVNVASLKKDLGVLSRARPDREEGRQCRWRRGQFLRQGGRGQARALSGAGQLTRSSKTGDDDSRRPRIATRPAWSQCDDHARAERLLDPEPGRARRSATCSGAIGSRRCSRQKCRSPIARRCASKCFPNGCWRFATPRGAWA